MSFSKLVGCSSLLFLSISAQPPPADPFVGYWRGTVDMGSTQADVGLDISKIDRTYVATADDIGLRLFGIPVTFLVIVEETLHLEHPTLKAVYDANLSPDGQRLIGTLTYGKKYSMNLRRSVRPPLAGRPIHPQEPAGALSYSVDGVRFLGNSPDLRLRGTLFTPQGAGPFPAVVLVSMAGRLDRDETIAGQKPFLVLADLLAKRGIATLRVDSRSLGSDAIAGTHSSLVPIESIQTMADDALSALRFLQKQSNVDSTRAGFVGHGEGGLAAALASQANENAFLVLLASPGISADRLEIERMVARFGGASTEGFDWFNSWIRGLIEIARREPDPGAAKAKMAELTSSKKAGQPEAATTFVDPTVMQAMIDRVNSPGLREWIHREPAAILEQLKIPVLVLAGSQDLEVPAAINLPPLFAAMSKAGRPGSEAKELPGLNHLFQRCATCKEEEYGALQESFSPAAAQYIASWVLGLAKAQGPDTLRQ